MKIFVLSLIGCDSGEWKCEHTTTIFSDQSTYSVCFYRFTHGVLNTDNISLFGVTIDYGPFGFVEAYNPDFIPNSSDSEGRYAYSQQPRVSSTFNRFVYKPLLPDIALFFQF